LLTTVQTVCYNTVMKKNTFLDTPGCVKSFYNRPEKEFCVHDLGYHNFEYIRPLPVYRTQTAYSIHLVISGKGRLEVNHKVYRLQSPSIFVLPPDELFCYFPDETDPWEYIFFDFSGTMVKDYLASIGFSLDTPVKPCTSLHKTLASFSEFFEKNKNDLPTSYFEATGLLFLLFNSALDKDSAMLYSNRDNPIEEAKSLIQLKFYDPDLTVESIASALHVSHSQLCRQFKEITGMTMIAYVNDMRMKYAEQLFKTTALKATEIAYMAGFREYTYFLMLFKRRNGMTTTEYRNLAKQSVPVEQKNAVVFDRSNEMPN